MARVHPERIEAARTYAEKEVQDFLSDEFPGGETGRGPFTYFLWWHYNLAWSNGPHGPCIRVSDRAASSLCMFALDDAEVHKLVREIIASRVYNNMPLSDDLRRFACSYLLGNLPKPKSKPGVKASKNFERDMFIIWTLENIETCFGVPPTQGDFRGPELPPNGSGILAKAFADAGRHEVTVKAVKEIWFDQKKRRKAKMLEDIIAKYKEPPVNHLAEYVARVGN